MTQTNTESKTLIKVAEEVKENLLAQNSRSAWDKGVSVYALDLINEFIDGVEQGWIEDVTNTRLFEKVLLNGASSWSEYSWGGSALIYNYDIAERLCNPTEWKRCAEGTRKPNSNEEWLDTQARALYQACHRLCGLFAKAIA